MAQTMYAHMNKKITVNYQYFQILMII
jgi:hypothetical protein